MFIDLCGLLDKDILLNSFDSWDKIILVIKIWKAYHMDVSFIYPYFGRMIEILRASFITLESDPFSEEFVAMRNYRIYSTEIIVGIFYLMKDKDEKAAEDFITSMIVNTLPNPPTEDDPKLNTYLSLLESFVYFSQSLLDAFEIADKPIRYFLNMIKITINTKPNPALAHTSLLYIQDAAKQLCFEPDLINLVIDYLFYVAKSVPRLQILASKTIEEIVDACFAKIIPENIAKIEYEIKAGINIYLPDFAGVLSKTVAIYYSQTNKLPEVNLLDWIVSDLQKVLSNRTDLSQINELLYILTSLNQYITGLIKLDEKDKVTTTQVEKNANFFISASCHILNVERKKEFNLILEILIGILEMVSIPIEEKSVILGTMMKVWEFDINNVKILKVISKVINNNDLIPIVDKICEVFIMNYQQLNKEQIIISINGLADFLNLIIKSNVSMFMISPNICAVLEIFCNFISTEYDQDANKRVLILFMSIMELPIQIDKEKMDYIKANLMKAAIQSIHFEVYNTLSLSKLITLSIKLNPSFTNSIIMSSFTDESHGVLPIEAKKLFIDFLDKYKNDDKKIKEFVKKLHNFFNSLCTIDELMQFQLEINVSGKENHNMVIIE